MNRVAYHNLGCKVNYYELEAVIELMKKDGYSVVSFDDEADVYIINTCSVTNTSDQKSRQMISRARTSGGKNAVVIAMGCYVQEMADSVKPPQMTVSATKGIKEQKRADIKTNDIHADIIIGNNRKHNILNDIKEFQNTKKQIIDCEDINDKDICYENLSSSSMSEHTRAFIKIQDGCNEFCSYCIIPYLRGRVRSRAAGDIIAEITKLAHEGCKEVVLTGIHISSYYFDSNDAGESTYTEDKFGDSDSTDNSNKKYYLIDLIEAINEIEGIERIRLGSLEPRIITRAFVSRLVNVDKVCPHFHLSLQSGSDSVLGRMNRKYTTEEFYQSCILLREYYKCPAITTDVIVGFPGETEEEFMETYNFLEKVHFYEMHIFKYSRREGTKADRMTGQIDEAVKKTRSDELLKLNKKMSDEYREGFIGKRVSVLAEDIVTIDGVAYYRGHTTEYIKALIKTEKETENKADLTNTIMYCTGIEVMGNALVVHLTQQK